MNIEDFKCCGNCNNRIAFENGDYVWETCYLGFHVCESDSFCNEWTFDNLTQRIRMIK